MIKLNPIETLPDRADKTIAVFYDFLNTYDILYIYPKNRIIKKAVSLTVIREEWSWSLKLREMEYPINRIYGWIYKDDLLAQLIPAHNVDIERLKIKNVEVSE